MPIFLRILAAANNFREWFMFANESLSLLSVAKRAAVVGAAVGVGAVSYGAIKPAPDVQQLTAAREAVQVAPAADIDLGECATGKCSAVYLVQDERRVRLALKIAQACSTTTEVSQEQCAVAERVAAAFKAAEAQVEREKRMAAARDEAPVGKLLLPHQIGGK